MAKEMKTGVYVNDGQENLFKFYTELSIVNKVKFVNTVCDLVVDGMNYNSVILEMIFNYQLVHVFTDVDLSVIDDSPLVLEAIEDFLTDNNIVDIIITNMANGLYEELVNAVNINIEYKTGIHKSVVDEAMAVILQRYNEMIESINLEELVSVAKKINENTESLTPERMIEAFEKTNFAHKKVQNLKLNGVMANA